MNNRSVLPWILLAVWSAWVHALQGVLAAETMWAPDLGLVLLVVLTARVQTVNIPAVALAVAAGRLAVSVDPPVAVLAGVLGIAALLRGLRSMFDIGGPLARGLLAAGGASALAAWLGLVHELRAMGEAASVAPGLVDLSSGAVSPRAAVSSAIAALLVGPLLARLPGLSPLSWRRAWAVDGSAR